MEGRGRIRKNNNLWILDSNDHLTKTLKVLVWDYLLDCLGITVLLFSSFTKCVNSGRRF